MIEKIEFAYHRVIDLKGCFLFESGGFWVRSFCGKRFVPNAEIAGISRIVYDRQTIWGVSQASPNKYRIEKTGRTWNFALPIRRRTHTKGPLTSSGAKFMATTGWA